MGCPCKECSYFTKNPDYCTFQDKPTEPDKLCWAQMYEFIDLCESDDCNKCSHYKNACIGDRDTPVQELVEHFHYGQGQALSSESRVVLISAGKQSGKTTLGPLWLYHQMQLHGNGEYLAVSSSFPLMEKKLIPSYIDFFVAAKMCKPDDFLASKKILKINGMGVKANIFFGSAKNAASLESSTALAAHLDEAGQDEFSSKAYDAVLGRLSRSGGKILITTTVYNLDWLYEKVYMPFTRGDADYDVIQFESIMSPGFSKVQFEWLRSKLPDWQFAREYQGLFSRPTGMIWSDFNEAVHVVEPFKIPHKWDWHVAIDPGAVNTAVIWVAEEPYTGRFFITRAYMDGNKTTHEHVQRAKGYSEFGRVKRWVGGAGNEQQFRDDWTNEGDLHVRRPEVTDVEAGIGRVTALWRDKNLFIFDLEENRPIINEIKTYSRLLDDAGNATDRIKDKHNQHYADSIRYFAAGVGSIGDYSTAYFEQKRTVPIFANKGSMNVIGKRKEPPRW